MSEWKDVTLGDILLKITKGTTPPRGKGFVEDGINYIKSDAISYDGRIETSLFVSIDEETNSKFRRSQLEKDDILFSMAGVYLGKNAIIREEHLPANTNQALAILRLNQDLAIPQFVSYFLRQPAVIDYVNNMSGQSAQPNVNFQEIASIEIPLPTIPEQASLVEVLSSLDDKIDLLHRQNKTLESMAETLFREWFVEGVEEEWEEGKIGDFVKTNTTSINKDYPHTEILYLDTGSLTEGIISNLQPFHIINAPSRAKRLVKHNDVLISTVRPNQRHFGILKNTETNLIVSTGFCVLSCKDIDPHFIYILLTTDEMTEYLHSIAEGSTSTYPSLKPSDIEAVEFLVPPSDKLAEFAEYADKTWGKITKNQTQIRTLTALRDTLLPKLMSGEVRVKV